MIFRVLAVGEEGREHVELLKAFTTGPYGLISSNHVLPLLDLIVLDDITFAVFPKVGGSCSELYNAWARSSVGDILDMIAQCLEVRVSFPYVLSGKNLLDLLIGSRLLACLQGCPQGKQPYARIRLIPNF